jgi:hypothetical protein
MSKPRVTTDAQDQELAAWYWDMKNMGTVRSKAKEMGISVCAVYDAIARGLGKPTAGTRFKLNAYQIEQIAQQLRDSDALASAPRGTIQSESIDEVL